MGFPSFNRGIFTGVLFFFFLDIFFSHPLVFSCEIFQIVAWCIHTFCFHLNSVQFSSNYNYYFTDCKFFTPILKVYHYSLSNSKSPQIFLNFVSILVDFKVLYSWYPLIFHSIIVWTVPWAPFVISITVNFIFDIFFRVLASSRYISSLSSTFSFTIFKF